MDARDVNLLQAVQAYLLNPHDTVDPPDRSCYRLTADDKRQIEAAISKYGSAALNNVTKGGAMLYLRSAMRFSGEDETYLRTLFAPDTVSPWSGPEKIIITINDSGRIGPSGHRLQTVSSYSPFEDRFSRLPYERHLDANGLVIGWQYSATMQARNSLAVLQQHGRIESLAIESLPIIASDPWQGIWVPRTKSFKSMGLNLPEHQGLMASEIGPIPQDGGDYLRYLLYVKTIAAMDAPYAQKSKLMEGLDIVYGQDGHCFGEYFRASKHAFYAAIDEFERGVDDQGD